MRGDWGHGVHPARQRRPAIGAFTLYVAEPQVVPAGALQFASLMAAQRETRPITVLIPPHRLPDVLVADIGMPGTDGLELIRRIRQTLPRPVSPIPAVALTAYARAEDRLAALASGFQMHLAKPVNPSELVSVIASLVGRR